MEDYNTAKKIMETDNPREMKSLGRQVKHFNEHLWDDKCVALVEAGNEAKFSQNLDLKNYLYTTYPKTLVEANPLDKIWGIGLAKDDPLAWDESTWDGKNLLGYALTRVRERMMKKDKLLP
ncbi:hypothetical protein KUTeg_016333 [Tegillarca granosa]|uniref:NADAR domain-containing protein n=1 Tax=Tegillarca granosa TaxID=220873 RepID=A0ABQ9ER82_TEGGR|nr:hypothetical protein KUTeg_016333 [Tegillarca granosa]